MSKKIGRKVISSMWIQVFRKCLLNFFGSNKAKRKSSKLNCNALKRGIDMCNQFNCTEEFTDIS